MNNTSEEVRFTAAGNVENTTESFQTPAPPTIPLASMLVGLIAGVPGTCANAVVVAVLIYARRHFGSNVNTLIANQSAMDLLACVLFHAWQRHVVSRIAVKLPRPRPDWKQYRVFPVSPESGGRHVYKRRKDRS